MILEGKDILIQDVLSYCRATTLEVSYVDPRMFLTFFLGYILGKHLGHIKGNFGEHA